MTCRCLSSFHTQNEKHIKLKEKQPETRAMSSNGLSVPRLPNNFSFKFYLLYRLRHLEKHQQMPKSAHFSLGNIIYFLFIGFGVHFGTCNSLFPCFNYFLLEHCDGMCSGLFICCKMFICNIIKLIFFSVP